MRKKRCTNSACRKKFLVDSICPYCGKTYPRLGKNNYTVELVDCGKSKISTLKALRRLIESISIHDAKNMICSCPCIVGHNMSRFEASLWCKRLEEAGATAISEMA